MLSNSLFSAKPEYMPLFSKLQGLNISNYKQSEGIKYYGRTLVDDLVKFVQAGAQDAEYQKLIDDSIAQHRKRNVNKEQFLVSAFTDWSRTHL